MKRKTTVTQELMERVLDAVASCFSNPRPLLANVIKELKNKSHTEVLQVLSTIERTPRLAIHLWHVVVLAKAVLNHMKDEKELWEEVKKQQSL